MRLPRLRPASRAPPPPEVTPQWRVEVSVGGVATLFLLAFIARLFARRAPPRSSIGLGLRRRSSVVDASIELHELIARECPSLSSRYAPTRWASSAIIQTTVLYAALHRINSTTATADGDTESMRRRKRASRLAAQTAVPTLHVERELFRAPDGGTVGVDWLTIVVRGVELPPASDDAPIVVGFPGVGNCDARTGFMPMIAGALLEDFAARGRHGRAALVVYPGFNGLPLDSHKLPGSAYLTTSDPGVVLSAVRERYPHAPIIVVACSFGSALVVNWAARHRVASRALRLELLLLYAYGHSSAATACTADFALGGATGRFITRKWQRFMLDPNHPTGAHNLAFLEKLAQRRPEVSIEALRSARSIGEWDEACSRVYGFESVAAMIDASEPLEWFAQLPPSLPVVLFNADDDWLCPSGRIESGRAAVYDRMPNVVILSTHGGGHLGWVDQRPGAISRQADEDAARERAAAVSAAVREAAVGDSAIMSSPPPTPLSPDPGSKAGVDGAVLKSPRMTTGEHCRWLIDVTNELAAAAVDGRLSSTNAPIIES